MTREMIFDIWAPRESRWSPWVKPVLFSFMSEMSFNMLGDTPPPDWDLTWLPPADGSTLLIFDLPGDEAAAGCLGLARFGYRPVPIYNAIPWEPGSSESLETGPASVVDVVPIVQTLRRVTPLLATENLVNVAPPAFLMDASRRIGSRSANPGCFDNRSVSFPTDFPSANFLLAHGVRCVVLAQRFLDQPQSDLAHTLRAWQDAGIAIKLKLMEKSGPAQPIQVTTPSWFGSCFYRALEMMGFRRSVLGGFGGLLPEASSG
jgi:hypothetical protein